MVWYHDPIFGNYGMVWGIDRSVPHTPYPTPHTPDPGKVPKNLRPKKFFSACLQKGILGVRDGRVVTKSGVSTLGYGVWGIDRSGPRTPYPIPHASHTRSREGSKKSQTKEHDLHLITQVNFGSRDGRGSTKSGVSTLGYGVWGIDRSGPRTDRKSVV